MSLYSCAPHLASPLSFPTFTRAGCVAFPNAASLPSLALHAGAARHMVDRRARGKGEEKNGREAREAREAGVRKERDAREEKQGRQGDERRETPRKEGKRERGRERGARLLRSKKNPEGKTGKITRERRFKEPERRETRNRRPQTAPFFFFYCHVLTTETGEP